MTPLRFIGFVYFFVPLRNVQVIQLIKTTPGGLRMDLIISLQGAFLKVVNSWLPSRLRHLGRYLIVPSAHDG